MQWRAATTDFVSRRGMAAPTGTARGQKIGSCRCGKTIEAQPFSGQTCPIEPAGGTAVRRTGRTGPNLHGAHHSGGKRVSPLDLLPSPMSACVREDTNPPDQPGQTSPDAGEPTACCNWATGRAADDMLLMRQLAEPGCSPATALVVAGRSIDCYGDWYVFQPDG